VTRGIEPDDISRLTAQLPGLIDPATPATLLALLRLLYGVGRTDLPLGRVFEGHVDALQIITRLGTAAQARLAEDAARGGGIFGVWNADLLGDPLRLNGDRLSGGKAFASGAGLLSHALVSVDLENGRQLLLIDLTALPPAIDTGWWHVTGMQRSETHQVRWDALLPPGAQVGQPGDYMREPWFSGGALRFAAVQAGGIAGVVDRVRDHLVAAGRASDPYQAARLAELHLGAQSAADAVARAAQLWRNDAIELTLANVAAARVAVYQAGERVLTLAQAAVGVQAMFVDHPLSAMLSDLNVYLRQPAPDAQRARLGAAAAAGVISPSL
jgi:hypothetical protein